MPDVAVFLLEQSVAVRAALYVASLMFLSCAGGFALACVIDVLDAVGGRVTANRDWQVASQLSSKEDVLQLGAVALYAAFLISIEPPIRALASVAGNALVTTLILAPIAGLVALNLRKAGTSRP